MHAYLITSPAYYTQEVETFKEKLTKVLQKHAPQRALYRDKTSREYRKLAPMFIEVCHSFGVEAFLHGDLSMACELGADGVHLTSTQFSTIQEAKEQGMACGISTHTLEEIQNAEALGAEYVTYSPIFASPDKGEPIGIEALVHAMKQTSLPIYALGGIVEPWHVEQIAASGAYGFASIRYFYS